MVQFECSKVCHQVTRPVLPILMAVKTPYPVPVSDSEKDTKDYH